MKSRFIAFFTHIALSSAVAILAIFMVFFVWYPSPLADAFGVTQLFIMLLSIDVIIGPILTFIVYQPLKKSLVFDLSVIALLQIIALTYGMSSIFQGRPAFVVFSADRFEVVRFVDINEESRETARAEGNISANPSWLSPQWIAAIPSKNIERRNEILFSSLQGGADLAQLPELYVPLAEVKNKMLSKAKTLHELKTRDNTSDINAKLQDYTDTVKWLPLQTKTKDIIVLIDAQSAEIIKIVDINPYL